MTAECTYLSILVLNLSIVCASRYYSNLFQSLIILGIREYFNAPISAFGQQNYPQICSYIEGNQLACDCKWLILITNRRDVKSGICYFNIYDRTIRAK